MRSVATLSCRVLDSRAFLIPIILLILILTPTASGQSAATPQSPPPSGKHPIPADQEQFFPYWTTETGWDTELQLRNNLASQTLVVTPFLRTADGMETPLAAVTLQPREVQSIDLSAVIGAGTPQLAAAYGSIVLRYHSVSLRNLYAAVMLRAVGHPIAFHVDATGEIQNYETASREGIWWLPNDSVNDYLILNNQGANPIQLDLSLFDSAGKSFAQKVSLGPRQTSRFSVRKLVQLGGLTGSYGGIKISAAAHAGTLDSLHFLFDTQVGFSALLKMFDHDPNTIIAERDNAKTGVWTLRAPMLALTQPDPALAFPQGTTLQPQLFIRNTTNKSLSAALRFNWRGDTTTGKVQGPTLQLRPNETRRIDIASLQDGKILPKDAPWTSVTITTNSLPDALMAVAASYDATLLHGAQTPFSDQLAFAWEGGMWEYDAQHDSLMTTGNGGTKPTRAALTLFYNRGTARYDLEQTLQPDEQMWIDVGKLIREHVPDKSGKVLPADLSSGSYEFRDLGDPLAGTLFEGKVIYEKTYGHVIYGCMNCCDYTSPYLTFDPLGIPLLGNAPNGVWATDCNQNDWDVSSDYYGSWTTGNTTIAKVDSDGNHTGVAVGSTSTYVYGPLMTQHGRICYNTDQHGSGGDNVITLNCPSSVVRAANAPCSVSGAPSGTTFSGWKFTDSNNNTVSRSGNNNVSSWSGIMVTSGTVTVNASSSQDPLTASITVTARSSFTFAAVSSTVVPNNSSPGPGCTLSIPSPPVRNSALGSYCLEAPDSFTDTAVSDSGLNQGYHYVMSISSSSQGTPTAYYYVISPDLSNTSSAFYKAQTGTYNAQTNPNGYISGSNLLTDAIRHESGTVNSHYQNYVTAQNNPAYNLGVVGEAETGPPSQSQADFESKVNSDLTAARNTVIASTNVEPCGSPYVGYDATCTFQGYVNYTF